MPCDTNKRNERANDRNGDIWSRVHAFFEIRRILPGVVFLSLLLVSGPAAGEGSKQLNSNGVQSTRLYLCNDFTNHCNSGAGYRSHFATYNNTQSAAEPDRLHFVTLNAGEVVYMGFQGGSLSNPARHIVYRIKNSAGTIVQAEQNLPSSGTGYIASLAQASNGPNQLILTPPYNGYDAMTFTPPAPGLYSIEFSMRTDNTGAIYEGGFYLVLFDITVGNTTTQLAKPGRVYSKCWQFYETSNFTGINYVISDDSVVTSATFASMSGGHWNQYCNQTGCGNDPNNWTVNRKSLYEQQALYPQYRIFLNEPDPLIFPPAVTPGAFVAPMPYGVQNCQNGHILFHIKVNKPGNVELTLSLPPPYVSRVLNQSVTTGVNLVDWDGLDGTLPAGVPVPNNTPIQFTVKYINGLTNLPLYDVEANSSGFTIALVSPAGPAPSVFWDDTNIPSGTNNSTLPGCTSPPGCHAWGSSSGSGFGDLNTINTWWYTVSTNTTPVAITEFRGPQPLSFVQEPPFSYCANTGGHVFSVYPDVNTDVYHWSYTPSAGVTITQPTPGSYTVTVTFGAGASSGVLTVFGSNTNCTVNGASTSVPVTVNPLPVPALNGPASACTGQTGNVYLTEAGKVSYQWLVSSGGTITTGGSPINNSVTVTWTTAGPQSVSVNYQNPGTLCTAAAPTVLPVTVHARPVPSLAGAPAACIGSAVVYSTDPGKSNYTWTVSSGGTITAGGTATSPTATVTWNATGLQTVSVNYTDPVTNCQAAVPVQVTVTVNTLPIPTFTAGPATACVGVPGYVYATQAGMSNYVWIVSGGTVIGGGGAGDPSVNVLWNTTGTHSVAVNYTYPGSSCTAAVPTVMSVMVQPLPVPSILSGNTEVCSGSAGNTYTTQPGKSAYFWVVSGGNITAGGGLSDDYATVTWTVPGAASVAVGYTDPVTGCTSASPAVMGVTVHSLPVPEFLSGDTEACLNSPGHFYTTLPGMTGYLWTVAGGAVTGGGGTGDPGITVTWTSAGNHSVGISYTDPSTGCSAAAPASFPVEVHPLPMPSFEAGVTPVCNGTGGHIYATQPGMAGYVWNISGGVVTAGGTPVASSAEVTWTSPGQHAVSVGYADPATQCESAAPATFDVTVQPLPEPTLTGSAEACVGNPGYLYATEPGMTNYAWSAAGGTVTPGPVPGQVFVEWNATGIQALSVAYTGLNGCDAAAPVSMQVLVNPLPTPAVTGPVTLCTGISATYVTDPGMTGYLWNIPPEGTITGGGGADDDAVTVAWTAAGSHQVSINYSLSTGCTASQPSALGVTVYAPTLPVIAQSPQEQVCRNTTFSYTCQAGMTGYSWSVSAGGAIQGSSAGNTISVHWNTAGLQWVKVNFTNPDQCTAPVPTQYDVMVNPLPVVEVTEAPGPECTGIAHTFSSPFQAFCLYGWSVVPAFMGGVTEGQGSPAISVIWQSPGAATVAVTGTDTVTGCVSSASIPVTVNPSPSATLTPCFDLVTTPGAQKIVLRGGNPAGGTQGVFSGNRISLNTVTGRYEFNPSGATPGDYQVFYTYTNVYGCPDTPSPVTIQVVANPFACGDALTDPRDGHRYRTALFGGRCWMTENLGVGSVTGMSVISTDNCVTEKHCPTGDPDCGFSGGLYRWDELMCYGYTYGRQGLCPPEWHLPGASEWRSLLIELASPYNPPDGLSGGYMKDPYATEGFHAIMTGLLYSNLKWSYETGDHAGTMFWTSTTDLTAQPLARGVNTTHPSTSSYYSSKANVFPARCVKD